MGELGFNKIFGAILATFLFIFGLNEVATRIFGGGAHHGDHHYENDQEWAKANFHGWEDVVAVSATSGDAVEEAVFDLGLALANADPAAGEAALKGQCAGCHSWNERGTSMAFAGLRSPRRDGQRMDIIAYLASTTADAPAFPAPLATEASAEETAIETVEGVVEEATGTAGTTTEAVEGAATEATEAGTTLIEQATEAVEDAGEDSNNLLQQATDTVEEAVEEVVEEATDGEH